MPTPPEGTAASATGGKQRITSWKLATVSAVVVVALVLGAFAFTDGFGLGKKSDTTVLVPAGTTYSLPGQQYNAIAMNLQKTGMVSGTFANTLGITLYTMTPAELLELSRTGVVSGYSWTSGRIANLTVTHLSLTFQVGEWDLVFLNQDGPTPDPFNLPSFNTTSVAFYTELTLTTG
jgi:hypothetical protein